MDDRNKELNFNSSTDQNEVRIRNAIMLDGHAAPLPSIAPECSCNRSPISRSELHEDENVSLYAKRIRDNLHHEQEYCPCYDSRDDG